MIYTLPAPLGVEVILIFPSVTVGAVLSNVTLLASVVDVTCTPALPGTSLKSMAKPTAPSLSPACIVYVAVHLVPDPALAAALPAMLAVGLWIFSEEVIVTVIVSPT